MALFSNSNRPNWVVQMPFDAAKQSVLRACATKFCWCGIEMHKVCWMHSCSCLSNISNFIFEQKQP